MARRNVTLVPGRALNDLTRFNEAIDQSLAKAVRAYTERVDESREMFPAILGHDLRSPLAAIKLAGSGLARSKGIDAKSSEMAQEIASTAHQVERMIHDLLDFAVTRLGQSIPIIRAEMNLETLCLKSVAEMQAAHPSRMIHCTLHGDLSGTWDWGRLWQVMSNLLGNAMQHGANHTPIHLSVTGEASDVVINIHNEGKPIPPDKYPSLFRPMSRRPDHGTELRPGSVGLGLKVGTVRYGVRTTSSRFPPLRQGRTPGARPP